MICITSWVIGLLRFRSTVVAKVPSFMLSFSSRLRCLAMCDCFVTQQAE